MKDVKLKIDIAKDGSGWTIADNRSAREAFVYKTPSETYHGSGFILLVPLDKQEARAFERQTVTKHGVTGLKVTNVKEEYIV